MGLAVYNSIILDLKFPTACFKKLLSPPVVPRERDKTSAGMCDFTLDDFSQVMPVSRLLYLVIYFQFLNLFICLGCCDWS